MSSLPGYSNITRVGTGGLGDVFFAVKDSTRALVAIKVLRDWTDQSTAWQRADRELLALRNLRNHPHVVHLEDVVIAGRVPHLVMEFAPGGSVGNLLDHRAAPLAVGEVVLIGENTAAALVTAHAMGIHHLDIKPQNLLIGAYGQVKVCDFGIAALTQSEQYRQRTDSITYRYASPEQHAELDTVGAPSDVFSLGITLVQLLVGPSWTRAAQDVAGPAPLPWPSPLGLAPEVVDRLNRVITSCLALDPAARPSAATLRAELESIATALGPLRVRELAGSPIQPLEPVQRAASGVAASGRGSSRPPGPGVAMPGAATPPAPRAGPAAARPGGRTSRPVSSGSRPPRRAETPTGRRRSGRTGPPRVRTRRGHAGTTILATTFFLAVVAAGVFVIPKLAERDGTATRSAVTPLTGTTTPGVPTGPTSAGTVASSADPEQMALAGLSRAIVDDRLAVEALIGSWVPQLASGRPGLADGAGTTTADGLLDRYTDLRAEFEAVLFTTPPFVGPEPGMYVAIAPVASATPQGALAWCRARVLSGDDCAARYVTRTDPDFPVLVYQT